MLLGLTYQLIRFIADLVLVRTRSDAQLRAEVLALRPAVRGARLYSRSSPPNLVITIT